MTITHETLVLGLAAPLPGGAGLHPALDAIAALSAACAHRYFVERHIKGGDWNELKSGLSRRFGLTHRQFSGIAATMDGKASAVLEGMKERAQDLPRRIASAEGKIRAWQKTLSAERKKDAAHRAWRGQCRLAKAAGKTTPKLPKSLEGFSPGPSALYRQDLRTRIHHKKRYVHRLKRLLEQVLQQIKDKRIRLCLGSRKLFKAQHHLAENGYASHAEWLEDWRDARSGQFFCIGSKDETFGNQTASWLGEGILRLRVPPALEAQYGKHLVLTLKRFRREGVQEQVGQIACAAAQRDEHGRLVPEAQGLSWRLVRRTTKHGVTWVAQVCFERAPVARVSDERLGAWGLDFNADHLAMCRVDRHGNPVERATYSLHLQSKSQDQIAAILGDASAWAVGLCGRDGVPLCAEMLDFREKKSALRERGAGYARMLSLFAYSTFHTLTDRRAASCGVEVRRCNAAYTSVIGVAKFGQGYALSDHLAAGCAIARRGLRFSERIARRQTGPVNKAGETTLSKSAFPLPARTRGKHVWSDWRRFSNLLRGARPRARTAVDEAGGRARTRPTHPNGYGRSPAGVDGGASRVTTAKPVRTGRQPAKPFRWRACLSSAAGMS